MCRDCNNRYEIMAWHGHYLDAVKVCFFLLLLAFVILYCILTFWFRFMQPSVLFCSPGCSRVINRNLEIFPLCQLKSNNPHNQSKSQVQASLSQNTHLL